MTDQVPEASVQSQGEQAAFLRQKLTGNRAFHRLRGKLKELLDPASFFKMVTDANSPTNFNSQWQQRSTDLLVMGNLLAKLRKKGYWSAYTELQRALTEPTFFFNGETVPLDQSLPFTLMIHDFPRALAMIKFLRSAISAEDLKEFFPGDYEFLEMDLEMRIRKLVELYKKTRLTEKIIRKSVVFENTVLDRTISLNWENFSKYGFVSAEDYYQRSVGLDFNFGTLLQAEPDEILRQIPRDQQKNVSIWFFRLPRILWDGVFCPQFAFGFYPESSTSKGFNGPIASPSCCHRYRAVYINLKHERLENFIADCEENKLGFSFTLQTNY
ncbi:MAG: hypothetical protein ACOZBH_02435 [Patescibacteria group bacterium]